MKNLILIVFTLGFISVNAQDKNDNSNILKDTIYTTENTVIPCIIVSVNNKGVNYKFVNKSGVLIYGTLEPAKIKRYVKDADKNTVKIESQDNSKNINPNATTNTTNILMTDKKTLDTMQVIKLNRSMNDTTMYLMLKINEVNQSVEKLKLNINNASIYYRKSRNLSVAGTVIGICGPLVGVLSLFVTDNATIGIGLIAVSGVVSIGCYIGSSSNNKKMHNMLFWGSELMPTN